MKRAYLGSRISMYRGPFTDFSGLQPLIDISRIKSITGDRQPKQLPKYASPRWVDKSHAARYCRDCVVEHRAEFKRIIESAKEIGKTMKKQDIVKLEQALNDFKAKVEIEKELIGVMRANFDELELALNNVPVRKARGQLEAEYAVLVSISHYFGNAAAALMMVASLSLNKNGGTISAAHLPIVEAQLKRFAHNTKFLLNAEESQIVILDYMRGTPMVEFPYEKQLQADKANA